MPIAAIMLDVDNFKGIYKPFGHGGDTMINRMAKLPLLRTRFGGIASTYGGEEFTLVMPQRLLESISVRAGQSRREAGRLQVRYESRVPGQMAPSLGVADFPPHGSSAESLLQAAGSALYAARNDGRYRVAVAPAI